MNIFLRLFTLFIGIGAAVQAMANEDIAELEKSLSERLPQFEISYIKQTPIDGIYQVIIGGQVIYMTKDARYMIDGNLIDLSTKQNYSEDSLSVIRLSQIEKLGEAVIRSAMQGDRSDRHSVSEHGWNPPPKGYAEELSRATAEEPGKDTD